MSIKIVDQTGTRHVRISPSGYGAISGAPSGNYKEGAMDVNVVNDIGITLSGDVEIGAVEIKDSTTDSRVKVSGDYLYSFDEVANSLVPGKFDYINCSYNTSGKISQAAYRSGGSGGALISTLNIEYNTSGSISSVTKL